jgi:hypothetical protein
MHEVRLVVFVKDAGVAALFDLSSSLGDDRWRSLTLTDKAAGQTERGDNESQRQSYFLHELLPLGI